MAPDDGIEALVLSVNQTVHSLESQLEETQEALDKMNERLKGFLPRKEANDKADVVRKWFAGVIIAGMIVAASAFTGWMVNHRAVDKAQAAAEQSQAAAEKSLSNCESTRIGLRQVIEKAVSSNPTLRDALLSFDGTKPELCR